MERDEKICCYSCKKIYDSMSINIIEQSNLKDCYHNYNVTPSWMKTRLCLFWMLWATLVLALITSIFMYCYVSWQTCPNPIKNVQ